MLASDAALALPPFLRGLVPRSGGRRRRWERRQHAMLEPLPYPAMPHRIRWWRPLPQKEATSCRRSALSPMACQIWWWRLLPREEAAHHRRVRHHAIDLDAPPPNLATAPTDPPPGAAARPPPPRERRWWQHGHRRQKRSHQSRGGSPPSQPGWSTERERES
jgi:hypothetical protein